MIICPYCAHTSMEGVLFCEECGEVLTGQNIKTTATRTLQNVEISDLVGKNAWGTARIGREASVVIRIRDFTEPVTLGSEDDLMLGRADNTSGVIPALDLTPYGAQEKGVSRVDATIRR